MENEELSKEQFVRWKNDAVTKQFYKQLEALLQRLNDNLLLEHSILGSQLNNARMLGQREGVALVLGVCFEDLQEDTVEVPVNTIS